MRLVVTVLMLTTAASALAMQGAAVPDATTPSAQPALVLEGRTETLGYSGDFDHLAVDLKRNRLLLAAEDHGSVEVFALDTGRHVQSVPGFSTPHSLHLIPQTRRVLVTDGSDSIKLLDDETLAVVGRIVLHPGADSVAFDSRSGHLYVVTGGKDVKLKESWIEEIDPIAATKVGELHLDSAHVEAMAVEQAGDRLYVNVTDKNVIVVVDKRSRSVVARWRVREAEQNALAELDEPNHRLFVVARHPGRFIVIDTRSGKTVASLPAPSHVDAEVFDAPNHRIYATGGEGYVGVYAERDPDNFNELAHVASASGAKTAVLVPELSRLYVAVSPGEGRSGGEVLWFRVRPAR